MDDAQWRSHRLLLTPEQAAEILSVGRTRLFALISDGALKSVKIGRSRRVTMEACQEFVRSLGATSD